MPNTYRIDKRDVELLDSNGASLLKVPKLLFRQNLITALRKVGEAKTKGAKGQEYLGDEADYRILEVFSLMAQAGSGEDLKALLFSSTDAKAHEGQLIVIRDMLIAHKPKIHERRKNSSDAEIEKHDNILQGMTDEEIQALDEDGLIDLLKRLFTQEFVQALRANIATQRQDREGEIRIDTDAAKKKAKRNKTPTPPVSSGIELDLRLQKDAAKASTEVAYLSLPTGGKDNSKPNPDAATILAKTKDKVEKLRKKAREGNKGNTSLNYSEDDATQNLEDINRQFEETNVSVRGDANSNVIISVPDEKDSARQNTVCRTVNPSTIRVSPDAIRCEKKDTKGTNVSKAYSATAELLKIVAGEAHTHGFDARFAVVSLVDSLTGHKIQPKGENDAKALVELAIIALSQGVIPTFSQEDLQFLEGYTRNNLVAAFMKIQDVIDEIDNDNPTQKRIIDVHDAFRQEFLQPQYQHAATQNLNKKAIPTADALNADRSKESTGVSKASKGGGKATPTTTPTTAPKKAEGEPKVKSSGELEEGGGPAMTPLRKEEISSGPKIAEEATDKPKDKPAPERPTAERYEKMKKLGIPEQAIINKMVQDGFIKSHPTEGTSVDEVIQNRPKDATATTHIESGPHKV